MTEEKHVPTFPISHAIAGAIATGGALISLIGMPVPHPQRAELWMPALLFWVFALIFQLLAAAGHVRTAILDRQHLVGPPNFERRGAWNWVITHILVLGLVGIFYVQDSASLPLLSGQANTLVALLITNLSSLAVWSVRLAVSQTPADQRLPEKPNP